MIRLIWKEIRETIVLHLIISSLFVFFIFKSPIVLCTGYFSYGVVEYTIVSLIGFYSSMVFFAKTKKTLLFFMSRPISWIHLLIARMIPGIIIFIIIPFICLLLYYLAGYSQYIQFFTLHAVLSKLLVLMLHYLISYITGVMTASIINERIDCIPAKPVIIIMSTVSLILFNSIIKWKIDIETFIPILVFAAITGLFCGFKIIYSIIIKHKNTDFNYKIIRSSFLFTLIFTFYFIQQTFINNNKNMILSSYNMLEHNVLMFSNYSADGKYVIAYYPKYDVRIIDTDTGKRVMPSDSYNHLKTNFEKPRYAWLNNNLLLTYSIHTDKDNNLKKLSFLYNVDNQKITIIADNMYIENASSDGRFLLAKKIGNVRIGNNKNQGNKIQRFSIYTIPEMRRVKEIRYLLSSKAPYWQDNKVVYINENGKQQFLQVK